VSRKPLITTSLQRCAPTAVQLSILKLIGAPAQPCCHPHHMNCASNLIGRTFAISHR
jgi:hypothetical protein